MCCAYDWKTKKRKRSSVNDITRQFFANKQQTNTQPIDLGRLRWVTTNYRREFALKKECQGIIILHNSHLRNWDEMRIWEKALFLTTEGEKTTFQCTAVVWYFRFGHQKCHFWEWGKGFKFYLHTTCFIFDTILRNFISKFQSLHNLPPTLLSKNVLHKRLKKIKGFLPRWAKYEFPPSQSRDIPPLLSLPEKDERTYHVKSLMFSQSQTKIHLPSCKRNVLLMRPRT